MRTRAKTPQSRARAHAERARALREAERLDAMAATCAVAAQADALRLKARRIREAAR
jgi:uncharacterized membrane protein YqiK